MALVAIHFICPLRWNRNKIIKTLSSMKQRTQSAKKKRRNFFDTRSISANTEFDFQPVATSDGADEPLTRPYPTSILRVESSSSNKKQSPNTPDDFKGFPPRQMKKQPSQRSILVNQQTAPLALLPPENRSSFKTLHGNALSSSRGQLFKDQHRRPSMVTFQMDGKSKQNRFNTIAHVRIFSEKMFNWFSPGKDLKGRFVRCSDRWQVKKWIFSYPWFSYFVYCIQYNFYL